MTLIDRIQSRVVPRLRGGVLSVVLHIGVLLVIVSGGRYDGMPASDMPTSMLVLLEAPAADRIDRVALRPLEPEVVPVVNQEQLQAAIERLASPPIEAIAPQQAENQRPSEPAIEATEPISISAIEVPATLVMSDVEKAELSRRLERLAENSIEALRTEVHWERDGRQYNVVLTREPGNDGTALERVIAQVRASDRGRHLTTMVDLRRIAFSQFTQIVDRWDPMVQLHDDEIVGRFHSNSTIKLLHDSRTTPQFLGKVTTAAHSFDMESRARRRDSDIFRGGVETRAGRIELPESLQPFDWAPKDENARIHEFTSDTHIRFFRDGSYTWRSRESSGSEYFSDPSGHPVYFVAAKNTTLYVQGVVAGRVLVHSPHRIVIEGSLTYANDPRRTRDSGDYLGLVSSKYVEVAPPGVTGPGDLEINAAIFAGRRFVVTRIDHSRTATLRIYGSLAAGSLTATEPRYATKIEYDSRFDHQRPPGFPSTNRYEVTNWDGQWVEVPDSK